MDFRTEKYSEEEIREYISKNVLSSDEWRDISYYQTLSEDFIREFHEEVHWYYISAKQKLSEGFIKEFKDKVHWYYISYMQVLSESFIREFSGEVHWYSISLNQVLSRSSKYLMHDKVLIYKIRTSNNPKEVI